MTRTRFICSLLVCVLVMSASRSIVHAASLDDAPQAIDSVAQGQPADEGDDDRVEVMVWTVFASALALSFGLLLFLLRLIMGWVKAPPAQEEHH